ncbi:histidine kinase OS=Streptomyces microflavus OX=1919 GN=Smic_72530 PE=4 SV=1 [Streptomyces microflavus]
MLLRVQRVTAGLALEVEDRGLGMPDHEQNRMNALLSDPDQVNVAHLLQDGRIGLFVVSALARRHGIAVRLQSNIYGGTQAVLACRRHARPPRYRGPARHRPRTAAQAVHRPPADDGSPAPPAPPQVQAVRPPAYPGRPPRRPPATRAMPRHRVRTHTPRRRAVRRSPATRPRPSRGARAERADRPGPAASAPDRPAPAAFVPEQVAPAAFVPERVDRPAPPAARPELPKRANQEHLVPHLREAPAPRVEDEHALHDPGLMAAFRRGVDLAEAQTAQEEGTGYGDATPAPTALDAPLDDPAPLPVRGAGQTAERPHPSAARRPGTTPSCRATPCRNPVKTRLQGGDTMASDMQAGQVSDLDWPPADWSNACPTRAARCCSRPTGW